MQMSISGLIPVAARALVVATLLVGQSMWAQDTAAPRAAVGNATIQPSIYQDIPQFGGPTSVAVQLAEDTTGAPQFRLQELQDHFALWYQFKERLNQRLGLQFGIRFQAAF